ncbi:hypothetical protein D3C85_1722390 [compost metagenome]
MGAAIRPATEACCGVKGSGCLKRGLVLSSYLVSTLNHDRYEFAGLVFEGAMATSQKIKVMLSSRCKDLFSIGESTL